MAEEIGSVCNLVELPGWVPESVQNYIRHTDQGQSIRKLAKGSGCHASTVMRQVRKLETRRDDPLVDEALSTLGVRCRPPVRHTPQPSKDGLQMTKQVLDMIPAPDEETLNREARRILRRLCEPQACLAVAKEMEKAVVVRETSEGGTTRTAVVDRVIAQAMVLKEWIKCVEPGRISRYRITAAGRTALKHLLNDESGANNGFAEASGRFEPKARCLADQEPSETHNGGKRRAKYNFAESPVTAMARRREKNGSPFLAPELVGAAERLREDFELAQMGPRAAQNSEQFLAAGATPNADAADGPSKARNRVLNALEDLGPGLGDVALRVCCFLEGLEAAEKRMGWSARSGKIVLRIALQRLRLHYAGNAQSAMIG